jgi:hypothetical protein
MAIRKKVQKKATKTLRPKKSSALPVTQKNLDETRAELKSEITTLRLDMNAGFKKMQSEMAAMKSEMKSDFARLESMAHRILAVVEEQNAKFTFALDGYTAVDHRIDELEKKTKDV